MPRRLLPLLLGIFLLLPLSAQSPPPASSDAQIEAELRTRLARSVIGKDGFTARVKGGTVYWEGTTSVAQHKGAATRMAKSAGARKVVNGIRVTGAKAPGKSKSAPPAAAKPASQAAPASSEAAAPVEPARVRWVPAGH